MRIVLDTNVFLSAILFGGKPQQVLDAAISGRARIFISGGIVIELEGVLRRAKFALPAQFVQTVVAEVMSLAEWVTPRSHSQAVADDPTDNEVIDCAIEAEADYIVSGAAHLLRLGEVGRTRIVDADSFLRLIEDQGA